jgi:diaminopimelate epimerase
MKFVKMQGAGNDYVYIDCFRNPVPEDPQNLALRLSNRHFGVGSDGLILVLPSEIADARMRMFNSDGSESAMCGNGIRCVAKYIIDEGLALGPKISVQTGRGVLQLEAEKGDDGMVNRVQVDMGQAILEAERIPSTGFVGSPVVKQRLVVSAKGMLDPQASALVEAGFEVTLVSMGNPHCVIFVQDVAKFPVATVGPLIEHDKHFPERTNIEFVTIEGPGKVRIRTWERGAGETLACGTGASAVTVALAEVTGWRKPVLAHLLGGDLELHWLENGHVLMTGPAVLVFRGEMAI